MHLILRKLEPVKNGPSEKFNFSMPWCSILITDSEYITLFETPCVLRELGPIKVWLNYTGPKMGHRTSFIFYAML